MDDSRVQRFGAFGGFFFVVLSAAGIVMSGSPPAASDSRLKIDEYFADHNAGLRWGSYLGVLAVLGLLWWMGSLWTTLRRAEGGAPRLTVVAGLGLAVGAAAAGVSFVITSATALRHEDLVGSTGPKVFYTLSLTVLGVGGVGVAALVLATSVISIRSGVFPAWLSWGGVALGILWLVAAMSIASDRDGLGLIGLLSFVLWAIWIVSISVLMLRTEEPVAA